MNHNYHAFLELLEKEDKDNAVLFILDLLNNNTNVIDIYEHYLVPALSDFSCQLKEEEICIWKEHTRTSIIRTILESTYPYLIKSKSKSNKQFIVTLCPKEEYHEIGALIATNYFSYVGFKANYIGANTPTEEILSAINVLKPDYIALSATNYYNLVEIKRLTDQIRTKYPSLKIILGGQAFNNSESLKQISYDYHLNSLEDIIKFRDEVVK